MVEVLEMISESKKVAKKSVPKKVVPNKLVSDAGKCSDPEFVMQRAREFQASLCSKFPSFIKLVPSGPISILLNLPSEFINSYLPKCNKTKTVILESESGKEYLTTFCRAINSTSDGWITNCLLGKGWESFSYANKLLKGNALIFQLVQPSKFTKFKVYIVRDGPSFDVYKDFKVVINGLNLDSELGEAAKAEYYELCCSRRSYLHKNLITSLNSIVTVGIIVETLNIAEKIRNFNHSTSKKDVAMWNKTLDGFKLLGMDIAFLRARLHQLEDIAFDSQKVELSEELVKTKRDQEWLDREIPKLEERLMKMKDDQKRKLREIEEMEVKDEKHKSMIYKVTNAPW